MEGVQVTALQIFWGWETVSFWRTKPELCSIFILILLSLVHFDVTEKCKYWNLSWTTVGSVCLPVCSVRLANGSLHILVVRNIFLNESCINISHQMGQGEHHNGASSVEYLTVLNKAVSQTSFSKTCWMNGSFITISITDTSLHGLIDLFKGKNTGGVANVCRVIRDRRSNMKQYFIRCCVCQLTTHMVFCGAWEVDKIKQTHLCTQFNNLQSWFNHLSTQMTNLCYQFDTIYILSPPFLRSLWGSACSQVWIDDKKTFMKQVICNHQILDSETVHFPLKGI